MRPLALFSLAALVVLPLVAFSVPARAETQPLPQITVTGEGRVDAAPDMATISLGVTTQAATAAEAMAANSAALSVVLTNLRAAGIAERDLQTSGLSLNPVWGQRSPESAPRIEGYQASNQLAVRVRALARLGEVLDAAIKDGANTLNGLSFGIAEPGPLMREARTRAVADARGRAETLAAAAGVTLGPVITITEGGGYAPPRPSYRMDASMAMESVPVAEGEVSLAVGVTVVWQIVQ